MAESQDYTVVIQDVIHMAVAVHLGHEQLDVFKIVFLLFGYNQRPHYVYEQSVQYSHHCCHLYLPAANSWSDGAP